MALVQLQKTLAGTTAEQLTATSTRARQAIVQPFRGNAAAIYLGGSGVSSTNGFEFVKPTAGAQLAQLLLEAGGPNGMDLSTIYVRGTANDGVNVLYEVF